MYVFSLIFIKLTMTDILGQENYPYAECTEVAFRRKFIYIVLLKRDKAY